MSTLLYPSFYPGCHSNARKTGSRATLESPDGRTASKPSSDHEHGQCACLQYHVVCFLFHEVSSYKNFSDRRYIYFIELRRRERL